MPMLWTSTLLQMQDNGVGIMGTQAAPKITKKARKHCFLRVKHLLNTRK